MIKYFLLLLIFFTYACSNTSPTNVSTSDAQKVTAPPKSWVENHFAKFDFLGEKIFLTKKSSFRVEKSFFQFLPFLPFLTPRNALKMQLGHLDAV